MPSSSGAGRPTIGSTAGVTCTIVRSWSRMQDDVGGVLQHQPQPALAASFDEHLADVQAVQGQAPSSWPATRSDGDRARRRRRRGSDDRGLAGRPARRQRDEHERLGRGHAERGVQQRGAGQQIDARRRCRGTAASSAASRNVATSRSSVACAMVPPGSPSMRQARVPGWSTRSTAASSAASRTPPRSAALTRAPVALAEHVFTAQRAAQVSRAG